MSSDDENKLNRIEELKNKLFSQNYKMRIDHRDSFSRHQAGTIPEDWNVSVKEKLQAGEKFFNTSSVFKSFFKFSLGFFLIALCYALYVFFAGGNTVSKENIEISVLGNAFVAGGEELPLVIGIANKNSSALELVDLVIEYPKSATKSAIDATTQMERMRESLGTIPSGSVRNENVKLVLFGEQGSLVPIKISIEYRVEGSNAIFITEKPYEVTINSTPVNLSVEGPNSISQNQDVNLHIKASLNATNPLTGVMIKVDYPLGFKFTSATPAPSLGNNIWVLGDLAPGAERDISLTGQMVDVFEGEDKIFRVWGGTQAKSDKSMLDVVFNSATHLLTIKKPFIDARLSLNGVSQREYAVDSKTAIRGEIDWVNNLDTSISDLEIHARIVGNAVDRKSINALQGFYDSAQNMIVWDKNSVNQFQEVNPGDYGTLAFSLAPLSLLSTPGKIISDPYINIVIDISGKQAVEGYEARELTNSESSIVHIISDLGFATKALYYSGPFSNSGPVSPKVGQETTYTIVWSISNSANSVSKAKIVSTLPSWMRYVGTVSPASADLTYNAVTKEIIWNIGNISKGVGITSPGRELSFQVGFTPSLSQVGSLPTIINDATLTGHDDFANVDVRVNRGLLRTKLEGDPLFPDGAGMVTE